MERGRWLSVKSMKGYINQALQDLASIDEVNELRSGLVALSNELYQL